MLISPTQVKAEVAAFKAYEPGLSIAEVKAKYNLSQVIKMASNENPLGISPLVREAIIEASSFGFRYPQSGNPKLVEAIARQQKIDADSIVIGNGSDEVIDLLIRARVDSQKHNIVTFEPAFSIYGTQARLCGVEWRKCKLNSDFSFNWSGLKELVDENTSLIFVTSPDNPSGNIAELSDLESLAKSLPQGTLLVIDEAYLDFAPKAFEQEEEFSLIKRLAEFQNVAILRTFSKSCGLAGVRLGYGIFPKELADYLKRIRLPFSVNIFAEAAGLAALADRQFRLETFEAVQKGRDYLYAELQKLNFLVYKSWANFLMFKLPEKSKLPKQGTLSADQLFQRLLEQGIIIRKLGSYNLKEHLRVSVGNMEENELFIKKLTEILEASHV